MEGPGAYVLYGSRGTVVYVGHSRSLPHRLAHHVTRGDVPAISFGVFPTDTVNDARRLERELIREHEPPFNLRVA
jgi:excinuclease UvrABC nuclease subunit